MTDLSKLPPLTAKQSDIYHAILEYGGERAAANALGIARGTLRDQLACIRKKGYLSLTPAPIPEGMAMKATCVQYNREGMPVQEWRRLCEERASLIALVNQLAGEVRGTVRIPKRRARKTDGDDALGMIALADAHIGMFAWGRETGGPDYNVERATDTVLGATDMIAERLAPHRPRRTIVAVLGDQIHSDNRSGKTEKSGNVLDVDTRYQRVVSHARRCFTDAVARAAEVSGEVLVEVVPGNHDWHFSWLLSHILDAAFSECEHISVNLTPRPRRCHVWGRTMLVIGHGDNIAADKWAALIPTEFPREWGMTSFRHMYCGHVHHQRRFWGPQMDTHTGLVLEYLRALCPGDAWHGENGFIGPIPGAEGFLFHKQFGLDSTWYFNSEQVLGR